jgi:hypothetical protein
MGSRKTERLDRIENLFCIVTDTNDVYLADISKDPSDPQRKGKFIGTLDGSRLIRM